MHSDEFVNKVSEYLHGNIFVYENDFVEISGLVISGKSKLFPGIKLYCPKSDWLLWFMVSS